MSFKLQVEKSSRKKDSKIVLALDQVSGEPGSLLSRSLQVLEKVNPYICALKLNQHLVLPLGLFDGVKKIVEQAHSLGLPVIMDCKINDVGYTNRVIAENFFKAGFDAIIASPFVGWEEGLQPAFEVARQEGKGVILLVYMSHKAAWEGYGQKVCDPHTGEPKSQYVIFAEKALLWKADGAVVGATYPDKIKEVNTILREKVPIYSPGVGMQGGDIKAAISSGAQYLIVGRTMTLADKPEAAAKKVRDAARL